jgi:hypothetical protein
MGNSTFEVARAACGALAAIVLTGACSGMGASEDSAELGSAASALGLDGPWALPAEVADVGNTQFVDYTGAGAWTGSDSCEGGMTAGAGTLREYLYEYFPQLTLVGGYACRHINGNESQTSVHATGRALDLHIPLAAGGAADNDLGDPIAHWLIRNAESMGIQYIIWDRSSWNASRTAGEKFRPYGGASPHRDHLHIELSVPASAEETPWFSEEKTAPKIEECAVLGAEGGILDDLDGCTQIMGPTRYWRHEVDEGFGESLFWTNATESEEVSNWARWQIDLLEAGQYELEVFVAPEFAVHQAARYELQHAGELISIEIDQSAADGWHSMGLFDFAAGREQHLALFDNSDQEVGEGQRIVADAIRLTRSGEPEPEEPEPEEPEYGDLTGGCQSGGGKSSGGAMLCLALALLILRKSKRSLL